MSESLSQYLPLGIQFMIALGFVLLTIVGSWFLGPKVKTQHKLETFEAGLDPVGNARVQFSIKYFLVATLFVLFDVEVIFFYPWAVNFKTFILNQGFAGFGKMLLFMAPVLVGFFYVIKKGALDWE
ncbi:MAG TPA: NADH-quinone oxidoreductase subunit A [Cytophagaceae bacterium]|nr:NADH-quinone oxidoreductase subunit A [Cytophagaceae bacterium]